MNKCDTCFYQKMDRDLEAPCVTCNGYSNWVALEAYFNGLRHEDFWTAKPSAKYDAVERPKHYMLFPDKGIEVRDVLQKLVDKVDKQRGEWDIPYSPLFSSDYVQMMQYGMRFMDKNGKEDLLKMRWYLDKLIDSYESDV